MYMYFNIEVVKNEENIKFCSIFVLISVLYSIV